MKANLWAHDNLAAWCVAPFDAKKRGPEERARMLERLGFKRFAYDWRDKDVPTFDAEIEALQKHGIDLLAWWFPLGAENPLAKAILETFRRHDVHPQLWVALPSSDLPQTPGTRLKLLPPEAVLPELWRKELPKTPEEQERRVRWAADRVYALAKLAAPYGCKVELYNHNGWSGMVENQLAIIGRLEEMGVNDVGLAYNFSHARDALHDDTRDFPALWEKMKAHVAAVNITGTRVDLAEPEIYPSQGDRELEMMRTIQESCWRGPIGLLAENGGDAEVTLGNYITGLDWLAAELRQPGSGGPRPFPLVR